MTVVSAPRVLITRPRSQAGELARAVEAWGGGAHAVLFPTVEILPPLDPSALARAVARLATYDWIVFTSANAVTAVFERLGPAPAPAPPRIAAVGPATAAEVRARGGRVDFVPSAYLGAQLGRELPDVQGRRILVPQGDQAGGALSDGLRARGALVDLVEAYRTAPPEGPAPHELADLAVGVDAAIFTSGSAIRHLFTLLGDDGARLALGGAVIACIGPVTSEVARSLGLEVHVEPREHTVAAVLAALHARLTAEVPR